MGNVDKVLTVFQGLSSCDSELATRHMDPSRYIEHDPHVRDGVAGFRRHVEEVGSDAHELRVIRVFEDGDYVVTQADSHVQGTFFDVFRFDQDRIVEHWGFCAPAAPANRSGHTQADGPIEPRADVDAARSKAVVRDYYETVHLSGQHGQIRRFMAGDLQIRHEPGVADGVGEFMRDLEVITRDRTIDEIALLLGQGDFVFIAAKGTHRGEACVYVDLYRLEDEKLVEHWGFPMQVPPLDMCKNANGMV